MRNALQMLSLRWRRKKISNCWAIFVALVQHFDTFFPVTNTNHTNQMEIPRDTNHDDTTRDLTATIIETLTAAIEDGCSQVLTDEETGDCLIWLRNGKAYRVRLLEIC